ncbi:MAG: hypothetical protein ABW090_11840 [Sedimenticola sp.]
MAQNHDSKDTRKAFNVNELPDDLKKELEKGYQGRETPELDHLLEEDKTTNAQKRRALDVAEITEDEIRHLEKTEMPVELNHLNIELDDD